MSTPYANVKLGQDIPMILVTGTLGDGKAVESSSSASRLRAEHQSARLAMAILRAQEEKALRDAEKRASRRCMKAERASALWSRMLRKSVVVLDIERVCSKTATTMPTPIPTNAQQAHVARSGDLSPPFQPDGRHSAVANADRWIGLPGTRRLTLNGRRDSQGDEIP